MFQDKLACHIVANDNVVDTKAAQRGKVNTKIIWFNDDAVCCTTTALLFSTTNSKIDSHSAESTQMTYIDSNITAPLPQQVNAHTLIDYGEKCPLFLYPIFILTSRSTTFPYHCIGNAFGFRMENQIKSKWMNNGYGRSPWNSMENDLFLYYR